MVVEAEGTDMPNDVIDPETGQFVSKYPEEAFLDALDALGETGTGEVAREVGCNRETARVRLADLADEGRIRKRKIGSVNLWVLAEEGEA